ncbi:hypothetical protein Ciccas_001130 [Cichlidogyrus casuarinus]|uniref:Transmembrane protein 144 n=1 Tax=Cichlidogyrus casuarinus TaxID=1844966 RepID=A0ABD2QKZ6_9PLAT
MNETTLNFTGTAVADTLSSSNMLQGALGILTAAVLYGICFAPVRGQDTGDGMFFQWLMCSAIGVVGIVTQIVVGSQQFYPLGLLGGAFWATGNICTVPVFRTIGMSLGILIWSMFNMIIGWASGRFGWFHITPSIPSNIPLNYAGVSIAVFSTLIYGFIKPSLVPEQEIEITMEDTAPNDDDAILEDGQIQYNEGTRIERTSCCPENARSHLNKPIGIGLAMFAGTCYGLTFTPAIYIQDNYPGASKRGLDYVMGNFLGIFLASSAYFSIYAISKRGQNLVPSSKIILPSFLSGVFWALATIGWFLANEALSVTITFPIITTIPCVIASAIGVTIFKEIRGRRNYLLLAIAAVFTISGVILTALSK